MSGSHSNASSDNKKGTSGNDILFTDASGGASYGMQGNDTLHGGGNGVAQSHLYGGLGDDVFILDTSNNSAPFGDHVWGGYGKDTFVFTTDPTQTSYITGRIDDFNYYEDKIVLDGVEVDLMSPPERVKIVFHDDQPWILIDHRILYALEGARIAPEENLPNQEERHFINWPAGNFKYIQYSGFDNYIPQSYTDGEIYKYYYGTDWADVISGSNSADYIFGGDRSDVIYGNGGSDVIEGEHGNDTIYGGAGDDFISGGLDNDILYGGSGNDYVQGGSGHDIAYGDEGNDTIIAGTGNDYADGGLGNDSIDGGYGNDTLIGGDGSDTILGGDGNDILIAGSPLLERWLAKFEKNTTSYDHLKGEEGDDTLIGSSENYTSFEGGRGDDVFYISGQADSLVRDFNPDEDKAHIIFPDDIAVEEVTVDISRSEDGRDVILSLLNGATSIIKGIGNYSDHDIMGMFSISFSHEVPELSEITSYAKSPYHHVSKNIDYIEYDTPYFHQETRDEQAYSDLQRDQQNKPVTPYLNEDENDATCFVATASFGGVSHPDVIWLRMYRNKILKKSTPGRIFIKFYWVVGPKISIFINHDHFSGYICRLVICFIVWLLKQYIRIFRGHDLHDI